VWPVAFSQSGGSPDLRAALQHCDPQRLHSSAFVNTWPSPLADAAAFGIALHAAPETAVAATKSVIAQMTAGAMLTAALAAPASAAAADLQLELERLPQWLHSAQQTDPEPLVQALQGCRHLYVIGRGQGLPIARELALKFKETCGLQAEAFSAAELLHGPLALAGPDLHALLLVTDRQSAPELLACAERLDRLQARVRLAGPCPGSLFDLPPLPGTYCPGVAYLGGLYLLVDALARRLGRDPDRPPHLNKVTLTF
ncbi:MAG: SIS domain-containing protein, partial [Rhodoferax sp.]|nr:SIS domain-containing protein [Rhodoferax sp.]